MFSWPKGHSGEFRDDLLTADPEFIETEIEEGDQFLLMACDGLWDVLGKPEAVERAKAMFAKVGVRHPVRVYVCVCVYVFIKLHIIVSCVCVRVCVKYC